LELRDKRRIEGIDMLKYSLKQPAQYFADPMSRALINAAIADNLEESYRLVYAGANPNDEGPKAPLNANKLRLLHYAIAANSSPAVSVLIKVGANPNLIAQHNGSAVDFCILLENERMLDFLLDLYPISKLSSNTVSNSMFEAVLHGNRPSVEALLRRGVPVDIKDSAGYTPLMRAISAEKFEIVELLLEHDASVHVNPPSGVTPVRQIVRMSNRYKVGSDTWIQIQHIIELMRRKGAVFPSNGAN
jgi:ankyrin repeat protein